MLKSLLRSRWFSAITHAALWLLMMLAILNLGGNALRFAEANSEGPPTASLLPIAKLQSLFTALLWPRTLRETNSLNPFFTKYFIPPLLPPPPPPTTRKVVLSYQGFFQTSDGPKTAFLKVADALVVGPPGTKAVANLFIADMALNSLTLTNTAAQTNEIPFNTPKELEVPLP